MRNPKQTHHYQGYRIHVNQNGSKWQATIYPPKSSVAAPGIASSRDEDGDEKVLAEAKQIIDARMAVGA